MSGAAELLKNLAEAVESKKPDAIAAAKKAILGIELTDPESVMAGYRVGLYVFYQEKNLDDALAIFKVLAGCRVPCEDQANAQITYAICLWAKDKKQQAIFELRKAISGQTAPSASAAAALDYLALFLRDSGAQGQAIALVNEERIKQLEALSKTTVAGDDQAQYVLRLAAAREERRKPGDLERALALYQEISKSKISKTNLTAAQDAIKRLKNKP